MREVPAVPAISGQELMVLLARAGFTDKEVAVVFGISSDRFYELQKAYPDLKDALDEAREEPNRNVEAALYKRALGYTVKEIVKENDKAVKVTVKEIAPDPVSCIFWLKNRDPKRWRDVMEMRFSLRDRAERVHEALSAPSGRFLLESKDGK